MRRRKNSHPCYFNGEYPPQRDTVILCDKCDVWYHRDWLAVLGPLAGLHIHNDAALPIYLQATVETPDRDCGGTASSPYRSNAATPDTSASN